MLRAALADLARRPRRRGRQHDHPAARQEPVPDARAQPRSQDPRDPAGAVAGAPLHQKPDPRNLSEPGLSRRRRLRGRRRGAPLFRQVGAARSTSTRARLIAGLLKAPTLFNPLRDPDKAAARTEQVLDQYGRGRVHHHRRRPKRRQPSARRSRRLGAVPAGQPLFRRLGRRAARRVRRRRPPRPDRRQHPRPPAAEPRPSGDRRHHHPRRGQGRGRPGRAGGDVARRRGARDGRRPQLRCQPVQSRHPGRATAGVRLQAVCLSRRPSKPGCARPTISSTARSGSAAGGRATTPTIIRGDMNDGRGAGANRSTRSQSRWRCAPGSATSLAVAHRLGSPHR